MCKQIINILIELLALDQNTWKHLTLQKKDSFFIEL